MIALPEGVTRETYGKGSLALSKKTSEKATKIIRDILRYDGERPEWIDNLIEESNSSCGINASVFEMDGYIFKLARCFREPDKCLIPHLVPTVCYSMINIYGDNRYLIVQEKIFGCAAWRKNRAGREWMSVNTTRFRHWHNIISWFARGTDFIVPPYTDEDCWAPDIKLENHNGSGNHFFDDVHAENIGLDNNKIKVLDW